VGGAQESGATAGHKQVVRDLFAALSERRFDDARALVTDDGTWWLLSKRTHLPVGDYLSGYEQQTASMFPTGLRLEPADMVAEDGKVAAQADSFAVTAKGRDYRNTYHFLFEFRDGRIHKAWEYGDTLYAEKVLRG
jgi:ketosteroid isomerase-like protein